MLVLASLEVCKSLFHVLWEPVLQMCRLVAALGVRTNGVFFSLLFRSIFLGLPFHTIPHWWLYPSILFSVIFLALICGKHQFCVLVFCLKSRAHYCIGRCWPPGGGGTHIFDRTGMCRSNGSLFYKKSMGPVFYQKILKHGSTFLTEPKFWGFLSSHGENPANREIFENGPSFQEKSLKMGTLFCQNHP